MENDSLAKWFRFDDNKHTTHETAIDIDEKYVLECLCVCAYVRCAYVDDETGSAGKCFENVCRLQTRSARMHERRI